MKRPTRLPLAGPTRRDSSSGARSGRLSLWPISSLLLLLAVASCSDEVSSPTAVAFEGGPSFATVATSPVVKIFFTDGGADRAGGGAGTIRSVNPDGTGLTTLVAAAGVRPRGIALDHVNGHIYWNDFGNFNTTGKTMRSALDGSGVTTLVDHGQGGVNDIDVDVAAGHVYMALSVSFSPFHGVRRVNTDGTGLIDLIKTWPSGSVSPAGTLAGWFIDGLTVDPANGHLYYGDIGVLTPPGPSGIVKTDLAGNFITSVAPHLDGRGRGVAVDAANNHVYFGQHVPAGSGSGTIWRANADGSGGLTTIVTGLSRPRDLVLDLHAGKILWVDELTLKIQSANLDGTGVMDIVTGLSGPSSLTLLEDATPPDVTAALVPVGDDDDEFRVVFTCTDAVDASPVSSADINGIAVANGQIVELELDDDEVEWDDGILKIEAPSITLTVTCTDASGNTTTVTVELTDDDDDDDDENG